MPERTALLPTDPEAMGPYRLEHRLGTGGQGTVYVGRVAPDEPVAIKVLHPHLISNELARSRFLREIELAKRVAPFCTAQVLDSGVAQGHPYIVSEFVDGPSLQDSVRDAGPRSGAALERLAINTVTALAGIHEADVVHRDFKPGNVLLGPDGPVVIDFGIGRALDLSQSIITSQAVGSPGYMAPEQIAEDESGPATDMFAWAATMVYAATGRRAFRGESIPAVMRSILHDEPDVTDLDGRLGAVVRDCLAKDPALRPTAAEVGDRLRALPEPAWETAGPPPAGAVAEEPDEPAGPAVTALDAGPAPVPGSDRNGRRRTLLVVAAVVALLVAFAGAYTLRSFEGEAGGSEAAEPSGPPPAAMSATETTGATASPSPDASESGEPGSSPVASAGPGAGGGRPDAPAGGGAPGGGGDGEAPGDSGGSGGSAPKPSAEPSEPPGGGGGAEPPSGPKTLGTVTRDDVQSYCSSLGANRAYKQNNGWRCYGSSGAVVVSLTTVCKRMYPNHSNVKADGSTCKSY